MNGEFTGNGTSAAAPLAPGEYNLSLGGFGTATVTLQRSFDRGGTWRAIESFTADAERILTVGGGVAVHHRLVCTGHAGGTIRYRLG